MPLIIGIKMSLGRIKFFRKMKKVHYFFSLNVFLKFMKSKPTFFSVLYLLYSPVEHFVSNVDADQ